MRRQIVIGSINFVFVLVSFFVVSCTAVSEKKLLRFPVEGVADVSLTERISAKKVLPDSLNLMGFAVYDNKLIVTPMYVSDYGLEIIDLTSGKIIQGLCRLGRGPGEFLSIFPPISIADESVIIYDGGTGSISEICLDGDNNGGITHQVKLEVPLGQGVPIIATTHKKNEEEIIVYNSIQAPFEYVSIESPYYALYDYNTGAEKRTFNLFDAAPLANASEWVTMSAFDLSDCINGDKTKVCFVMGSIPVYGFLDIPSGEVKGFRLKGEPAFSTKEGHLYFSDVCTQGQFIYALYLGVTNSEPAPKISGTILYKLDWEGHILKKYELEGIFRECFATSDDLYLARAEDDLTFGLYQLSIRNL